MFLIFILTLKLNKNFILSVNPIIIKIVITYYLNSILSTIAKLYSIADYPLSTIRYTIAYIDRENTLILRKI